MDQQSLMKTVDRLRGMPREAATVEFKSNLDQPEEIGQYLSALANSAALDGHERAWLVWGITDGTHEVKGTSFDPFTRTIGDNQKLVMWLQQMTSPRADFSFHECIHPHGKIVLLEIHPARSAPVAFQNVRYVRLDSHKTKLSEHPDKEARLWGLLAHVEDWSGKVIAEATLDDLDSDAVSAARMRFTEFLIKSEPDTGRHEQIRRDAAAWDVPTLLNKARITKQGCMTRSALVLLGRDEAAHFLSPADVKITWILRNEKNGTEASQHFGIPFLLATGKVYARIRNEMTERMPDGSLFPAPVPWYDAWVIREALHNCVAHQDYQLGGKINVVEYPDRLVFANLGQFIPSSVEWMLKNQSPPEHYRNQWLIDGMIRLRMIDQVGSGIRRMYETQRARFFPLPDYAFGATEQGYPRVEATITRHVLDVNYIQTLMTRTDLTLPQVLLLDKLQKRQPLRSEDVHELKSLKLIEGRAPNYYIRAKVAVGASQKPLASQTQGPGDSHKHKKLILKYLQKHGQATRQQLDELVTPTLPETLDQEQKLNKVRNLLQTMRRDALIERTGSRMAPIWKTLSR